MITSDLHNFKLNDRNFFDRHCCFAAFFELTKVIGKNDLNKTIKEALNYKKGPCLIDIISQPLQDAKAPVSEWIA